MAAPRVFVSSTFYDLRQIRADLELFIRDMGYEPILFERGAVAYGSGEKLEEYAYREVDLSDILVAVVGGRFGAQSQHEGRSITQEELKRALDHGTQVYIFVEQPVLTEYQTYLSNKGKDIDWRYVDDVRVYEHLEKLYSLPRNNPIHAFETAADITTFLRQQWAGLFHRFLQQQAHLREVQTLDQMQSTVKTLNRIVDFLTAERKEQADAIHDILRSNHPIFARLRAVLAIRYPIFFRDAAELNSWLTHAEGFKLVRHENWDDDEVAEWLRGTSLIKVAQAAFDEKSVLRPVTTDADWNDDWVRLEELGPEEAEDWVPGDWDPDDEPPDDWEPPDDEPPDDEPPDDWEPPEPEPPDPEPEPPDPEPEPPPPSDP